MGDEQAARWVLQVDVPVPQIVHEITDVQIVERPRQPMAAPTVEEPKIVLLDGNQQRAGVETVAVQMESRKLGGSR